MGSHSDSAWLEAAWAEVVEGHTRPNPPVGAIVVRDEIVLGCGHHAYAGGDHAEVVALKSTIAKGHKTKGATVYVTLEPCSHAGRVGACTDALIAAGVSRVVYGAEDPNPVNRNQAKRILEAAGIACEYQAHEKCAKLIRPFTKWVTTGLPFVSVKLAMSLDGRICDTKGRAKWVSSPAARQATDHLRHTCDAIMVGAETVRRDNPVLLPHAGENPDLIRVVISRSGQLPPKCHLLTDGRNPVFIYKSPKTALRELGRMGALHVLCEGGLKLATSMAESGLVDEWITVLASKVIGTRPIGRAVRIPSVTCLQD